MGQVVRFANRKHVDLSTRLGAERTKNMCYLFDKYAPCPESSPLDAHNQAAGACGLMQSK